MKFLTLILVLSIPSVESMTTSTAMDVASTYQSLLEAEEKGNLGMVMRYRTELVKACKGKELLTLLPGDENALLRLGCQRVIGSDHELGRRLDEAIQLLAPIVEEHIESDGPSRKVALKALLPLARSYGEKGQIDEAISALEKGLPFLESGSVDIREAWMLSGDLKASKGEVIPAKRDWSRLTDDLNKYGDDARARRNSSVRLALLGKTAPSLGNTSWFGGKKRTLNSMKGQVVLLDFWATWCGPCRMLMPGLDAIQQRLAPKGLQILGVTKPYAQGWMPDRENPKRGQTVRGMTRDAFLQHLLEFRRRFGVEYPFVVTGKQGFDAYKVGGIPMVVLVNKKGQIAWVRVGSGGEGLLEATLERLLEEE